MHCSALHAILSHLGLQTVVFTAADAAGGGATAAAAGPYTPHYNIGGKFLSLAGPITTTRVQGFATAVPADGTLHVLVSQIKCTPILAAAGCIRFSQTL